ncbi:TRAP transporter small permease [Sneathiella litorea]|uniref:TRAP transporter small permease protein n=1 Tax=Sneathiella litorea TaxID=2606216 RepID=A0A6L8W857_9PROT|nr:TRAP transporter small permease [Sneathiella litorea]MZR30652.1 TRAP transporter small permease subunit [Sneathiella litorea]
MRALNKLSDALAQTTIWFAAFTVILMCLHVAAGIVVRGLFSATLDGTVEIVSHFYMVIVAFVPWAYVQRKGEHVSVDILLAVLPEWANRVFRVIANLLTLIVLSYFAWALMDMAIRQMGLGELVETGTMDIPVWPARWIAFLGVVAMLCVLVVQLLQPGKDFDDQVKDDEASALTEEGGV